ncbi:MAG TPA: hypothetical protein VL295_01940 [Gemmatimonadales bacterium]|nr:hypothetical protein [Gemmatimonadales bacterium]
MADLSRIAFLAGAVPFLVLGTAHAWHTPVRADQKKGLSARDPAVEEAMATTSPRLTARTDLWRAWVGFNYSHSLGAVLFGLFVVLIGRSEASYAANASLAAPLALAVALAYLVLGIKYWFKTPIIGIAFSAVCFSAAWVLR